ncbi:epoxide hydrolase 6 [Stagonosporopsis vannaccii]|nr:epoxide hydrolase 6 [Stagonosporopsis vannaccii]
MLYALPTTVEPFKLSISDADIKSFQQLLKLSPVALPTWESRQEDRSYGVTRQWLHNAKDYWLNKYDWRAQEEHINSFPNFTTEIEGLNIHFIALFSARDDAIPILFMHGWPGSFIEFLPMAALIREKYRTKDLPYHVVIPSLPGYTLSGQLPLDRGYTKEDAARVMDKLMNTLGFHRYIAQGGDVGSFVATTLALKHDSCVAVHLNLLQQIEPPKGIELSEKEKEHVKRAQKWTEDGSAYAYEHGTRPSTIGQVLSSSPLALLAWIGEKFLEWSDADPALDTILTNVSLYWFTQCFPRSIYTYRAIFGGETPQVELKSDPYINKPLGFSHFPCEIFPGLEVMVRTIGNLVYYQKHKRGGHFAALECPAELLSDVEAFVQKAWKA